MSSIVGKLASRCAMYSENFASSKRSIHEDADYHRQRDFNLGFGGSSKGAAGSPADQQGEMVRILSNGAGGAEVYGGPPHGPGGGAAVAMLRRCRAYDTVKVLRKCEGFEQRRCHYDVATVLRSCVAATML